MDEQIHLFRSNCDASLIYDLRKLIAYVSKYASKSETTSGACNAAFDSIFSTAVVDETNTHKALQQVLNKVIGQRDISVPEAVHLLLGLEMHHSSFTVVVTSLVPSKLLTKNKITNVVELKNSLVEAYADREELLNKNPSLGRDILKMNFYDFATKYEMKAQSIRLRANQSTVVIQIFQKYSSSPKNKTFYLYCKFQLLRYKAWKLNNNDANTIASPRKFKKPEEGQVCDTCSS
jgi:hypothetical protein